VDELTSKQQQYWQEKAIEFVTHNPDSGQKPLCLALISAIITIRMRDAEITSLKGQIGESKQ
jgi:hypothetical protein